MIYINKIIVNETKLFLNVHLYLYFISNIRTDQY